MEIIPNEFQAPVGAPDPEVEQAIQSVGQPADKRRPLLLLMPPQLIGQQMLRPITYNFNENLKDRIYEGFHNKQNGAYYLNTKVDPSPDVINAAGVAADGILLDTTPIEQNWTFMFIAEGLGYGMEYVPGQNATVAVGYVLGNNGEPPVSPYGAIDPNAVLVFTHTLTGNTSAAFGSYGSLTNLMCHGADATGNIAASSSANELFAFSPKDMLSYGLGIDAYGDNTSPEMRDMIMRSHSLGAPNAAGDYTAHKFGTNIRSPQEHLLNIANSVGQGSILSQGSQIRVDPTTGMANPIPTQYGMFHENVISNMAANNFMPSAGFNYGQAHTISEISTTFNAEIRVQPIADHPQFDVTPQAMLHARLTGSAYIQSAVSAYLVKNGMLEIQFVWNGGTPDPFGMNNPQNKDFIVLGSGPIIPLDKPALEKVHAGFELFWRTSIIPYLTLLANGTPCYCSAHISTVNQTIIDLQFFDDPTTMHDGFYTASPNLSAIFNPNVYDQKTFQANADQVAVLTDNVGSRVFANDILPDMQEPVNMLERPFAPSAQPVGNTADVFI